MAVLAKLAKTLTMAAKASAHVAAEAPGHVRGHFATNSKTGVKSWVRDYQRKVSMTSRLPKVAAAQSEMRAATKGVDAAMDMAKKRAGSIGIKSKGYDQSYYGLKAAMSDGVAKSKTARDTIYHVNAAQSSENSARNALNNILKRSKAGIQSAAKKSRWAQEAKLPNQKLVSGTTHDALAALWKGGGNADHVSKSGTEFTFRRGFYYRSGSSQEYADKISAALTKAGVPHEVVNRGEMNFPFKGGAPVNKQSHHYATVRLTGSGLKNPKSEKDFKQLAEEALHHLKN